MRTNGARRPGSRQRPSEATSAQPGLPTGEARLLHVLEEAGAVQVTLDTGHSYELAPSSVPANLPAVGEIVPVDLLAAVALAAERKIVARRVFAMLDRRLQPTARLRTKLVEKGYSLEAVDGVLSQMREQGLYSDRRYAEAFCRDCLLNRAVGRRYLVQKLREKQVDGALAAKVAAEVLDEETEAELALKAAEDRWRRLRAAADYKALAKVVRFLTGRGFGPGLANRAARQTQPAKENDPEY